jgi:hypothetical protein
MANFIEKINIFNSTNFTNTTSRYLEAQLYYYGDDKKITYETYKRKQYEETEEDKFFEITKPLNYRPDLVSSKFYGTPDYWWKIMEYNGISDVYNFKQGTVIRLPNAIGII